MKGIGAFILLITLLVISCSKDSFITSPDARLLISADTLKFDTVFVSAGSTYRSVKITNDNDQKLRLSSLKLMGGNGSVYKMNVNGQPGSSFTNLELPANDSLYVFVQVNIDPGAGNLPFIARDSIEIVYNGKTKYLQLEAWGQNARYLRNKVVTANETWNGPLPYVILGSLQISANATLTIGKGTRIYMHADAPILVDGSLQVNGLKDTLDRVVFTGDRLDEPYRDFPASWPGIYFRTGSKDNILNYAVIRNAYQAIGIQDPSPNANPKLVLNECTIDNAYDAGILSLNSSIRARNCLVSNCGKNLLLASGGDYQFTHCTVVSYANRLLDHKEPVLTLTNYSGGASNALSATFRNCLFWGEGGLVNDEVVVLKNGSGPFNVLFDYGLWKLQTPPANVTLNQVISNQPPQFDSINTYRLYYDFRLKSGSPAVNKGVGTSVTTDLDGRPRAVGLPDLGCFERQ